MISRRGGGGMIEMHNMYHCNYGRHINQMNSMKFTHNYEEFFFPRNRINCRICPLLSLCHPLASLLRSHPFPNLLLSVLDFNLRLSPIQIIRRNCPGRLISLWVSPQILGYRGSTRETGLIKSLAC